MPYTDDGPPRAGGQPRAGGSPQSDGSPRSDGPAQGDGAAQGDDPLQAVLRTLRREYLAQAPSRLAELRARLDAVAAGSPEAVADLKRIFHQLAGSGSSYGFPEVSAIAREAERAIAREAERADAPSLDVAALEAAIAKLAAAFARADGGVAGGGPSQPI